MKPVKYKAKVVLLKKNDIARFKELITVFGEVFRQRTETVSTRYLSALLQNKHFIAMSAMAGEKTVGGLTAYIMPQYYNQTSEVYIYDIAIKKAHQRKGIGTLLLKALASYCKHNNVTLMMVEAQEKDRHAINFYKRTKGKAEKVMHFNMLPDEL